MPELPDLEVYREALEARILGTRLEGARLTSPFLLRSVSPPLKEANGRQVVGLRRLGKRLVCALEEELFLVLHRARLSPFKLSDSLSSEDSERLFDATRTTLEEWTERLKIEVGDCFPEKVTAFRPEMAVHGRCDKPCPDCEAPVQRILYAETAANYCARCQTEGRILADRVLSRLLKRDWPKNLEELEQQRNR